MKIGFLAPINGLKQYGDVYLSIVPFLAKKGHEVVHPLSVNKVTLLSWSPQKRDAFFMDYYARVNKMRPPDCRVFVSLYQHGL